MNEAQVLKAAKRHGVRRAKASPAGLLQPVAKLRSQAARLADNPNTSMQDIQQLIRGVRGLQDQAQNIAQDRNSDRGQWVGALNRNLADAGRIYSKDPQKAATHIENSLDWVFRAIQHWRSNRIGA